MLALMFSKKNDKKKRKSLTVTDSMKDVDENGTDPMTDAESTCSSDISVSVHTFQINCIMLI